MQNSFEKEILGKQKKKIEKMNSCNQAYEVDILGKKVVVLPKVFYPGTDTELLITTIDIRPDEIVLEVCSGTGVISLFAAERAKEVIATDINPNAIKNIKENAKKYGFERKINAIQANLFPNIKKQFEVIIINPPYTDHEAQNFEEQAFWDKDHQIVKRFFKEASTYLTDKGRIYLSWANFAGFDFIEKLAKEYNYTMKKIAETKEEGEIIFRVYEIHKGQ